MGNQAPTEQALFSRLQRQITHEGQHLHRCRFDSRDFLTLGRFYVTDRSTNVVTSTHIDLAAWLAEEA